MKFFNEEEIELLKTAKGGYTKATLDMLGVPWPPKKGWKKRYLAQSSPSSSVPKSEGVGIKVYVDGGCWPNPGIGGYGVFIEGVGEYCGGERSSTNNRMELIAAIEGLLRAPGNEPVIIYSDSKYVVQGITSWIHSWKKKGWKKNTVKNRDLWEKLDRLRNERSKATFFKWVKGHAGIEGNERADQLAKVGAMTAGAKESDFAAYDKFSGYSRNSGYEVRSLADGFNKQAAIFAKKQQIIKEQFDIMDGKKT